MSSLGTGFRSIVRNYRRGQAVTVGINPSRQYTGPLLHEPPALTVTNDYLTHTSPYNTMPALNLIDDEVVRPDRSPYEYVLEHPQVRIRDWAIVEKKLEQMVSGGREKLMVISDFDMTLSRSVDDVGESCWTTHGVFDNCANEVDPTLGGKFAALKAKYHPIEFCPNLSMEEKIPHMEAWWNGSHGYIIQAGFQKSQIRSFVEKSKIILRSGTEEAILKLETAAVPLVVFSAGLGNIIEMFFEHKFGRTLKNTHIISNMMQFDEEERVVDFSEPLIHTFCKNSSVIRKDAAFFHEVSQRMNVMLLGDSMGDIHMDVGVEKNGPTLRIGFLNANVTNLLDQYMDAYDIVIIQDQTMTLPAKIIDHILHNKTA